MRRRRFLGLAGSAVLLAPALGRTQPLPALLSCTVERDETGTRLRLVLEAAVDYHSFMLSDPPRLVIDLPGIIASSPRIDALPAGTAVTSIRTGRQPNGLRVVLDLAQPLTSAPRWDDTAAHPTLVLALEAGTAIAANSAAAMPALVPPELPVSPATSFLRPYIVAIDAGHGGKDPGAVSADAHYEKHIAMGVAGRLYQRLAVDPRYRPTMIRVDDHFVALHERVMIAHRRNADLFVSIHADAAPNAEARGASVYALSENGASSAMARWIADSENSADRMGGIAAERFLKQKDPILSKVLVDLSMSGTIASSLEFGQMLLQRLQQVTWLHQDQVGQAGFAVLKSPDIPSLLVETGFMSNRDDCRRLCGDTHQDELAQTLHAGIDDYFLAYPRRV